LTNQFFPKLEEIVRDKKQLKEFKRLPIDSAVLSYHKFDEIFQEPVAILFQDTLIESKFVKSCNENSLYVQDPKNGYVIAGMFHKYLNGKIVNIRKLKNEIHPLVLRKQILEQDNSRSSALQNNCYLNELAWINKNLTDSISLISYIDADLILKASNQECCINWEFHKLYNETLLKYLEKKPNEIIELLNFGNYNKQVLRMILENVKNPIHDKVILDRIIRNIEKVEKSDIRDKIITSLKLAKLKH
jgi:hypothetical protein